MSRTRHEAVPDCQHERNAAFLEAVRAGDARTAAALARAPLPEDATDAEHERWRIRRRLHRREDAKESAPRHQRQVPSQVPCLAHARACSCIRACVREGNAI